MRSNSLLVVATLALTAGSLVLAMHPWPHQNSPALQVVLEMESLPLNEGLAKHYAAEIEEDSVNLTPEQREIIFQHESEVAKWITDPDKKEALLQAHEQKRAKKSKATNDFFDKTKEHFREKAAEQYRQDSEKSQQKHASSSAAAKDYAQRSRPHY